MRSRRWPPIWVFIPLLALALSLVFGRGQQGTIQLGDAVERRILQEGDLQRTLGFFDLTAGETEDDPIFERNREGFRISLEIDPDTLDLMRLLQNRETFKRRRSAATVRFEGGPGHAATVTLRGAGALMAPRLSLDVRLVRPIQLTEDVELDRFYLMAMAEDPHHIQARWAYDLMAELGLFPIHIQYVSLALNGQLDGLALLIEPPSDGLRRVHSDTVAIHRRIRSNIFRTLWSAGVPLPNRSVNALTSLAYRPVVQDPVAAYSRHLDLDLYLTHLAASTILRNNDLRGELFLYERREHKDTPAPLRTMVWDPENVGALEADARTVPDPLIFTVETHVDRRIHGDAALYARYVAILRELLHGHLSADRLSETIRAAVHRRDSIDDGLSAAVQAKARGERAQFAGDLEARLRAWNAELLDRLADHAAQRGDEIAGLD